MTEHTIVIGGGVGGMVAALRARRHGASVQLVEARDQLGGLASSVAAGGTTFDGGPYILLDQDRLRWALDRVGVDLDTLDLVVRSTLAYTIDGAAGWSVAVYTDLDRTAEELKQAEPGSGDRYRAFVAKAGAALDRLAPLLTEAHSAGRFVTSGAWRAAPWTLASLRQLLRLNRLDGPAAAATSIWTLIAGGDPARAPGPMALVPALIHRDGAVRPAGGVHQIVGLLEAALVDAGVEVIRNAPVEAIVTASGPAAFVLSPAGSFRPKWSSATSAAPLRCSTSSTSLRRLDCGSGCGAGCSRRVSRPT
ncbi:MAG: NAD(P)-binding protein [Acidimicrobiia bacterium]|nr:NAD(P)-binding protein [Acidimicrobiia bacterium]